MTQKADIGGKRLISLDPDAWIQWITQSQDLHTLEIISSEFQWISRDSDVLIRTYSRETQEEFIILTELQLRYNSKLPRRMRAYAALAEEKYQVPVYPVLVNILRPDIEILPRYQSECRGLQARQDYQIINLWEVEARLVFERPLPTLLPFVPILQDGGEESTIREALTLLRQDEQLNELEPLLAFFASFVLESSLVQDIMRWDMAVLRESPWYRQIVQESEQRGIRIGREEGRQETLIETIADLVQLKFGEEGLQLLAEISRIQDTELLRRILISVMTVENCEQLRQVYL